MNKYKIDQIVIYKDEGYYNEGIIEDIICESTTCKRGHTVKNYFYNILSSENSRSSRIKEDDILKPNMNKKPTIEGDIAIIEKLIEMMKECIDESDDPEQIKEMEKQIKSNKAFLKAEIFQ